MITLKKTENILSMGIAGTMVAKWMEWTKHAVQEGMLVTGQAVSESLTKLVKAVNRKRNVWDTPFANVPGYNWPVCISINDGVVHGIPNDEPFNPGDIVTIDAGISYQGWCSDMATTVIVNPDSNPQPEIAEMINHTKLALERAISMCQPGLKLHKVCEAIEKTGIEFGYGVPQAYGGHGIGMKLHEPPNVPNTRRQCEDIVLREGMTICIEPIFTQGAAGVVVLDSDNWSVFTQDGKIATHEEHAVAIFADGPLVLTEYKGDADADDETS